MRDFLGRWLAPLFAALALSSAMPADAATYAFRSDSFSWETAANAVTWDKTCTSYPSDDDKATVNLTGGFTFTYAGTAYSSVRILANGILQFGADTGFFRNYSNSNLPAGSALAYSGCAAGAASNVMMVYWADMNPGASGSGNVSWEQKGIAPNRYLVVSWNSVFQYATSTPYAFQAILYENGQFKYQYGNSNATGSQATIGVQVSTADYTLYSFNSGYNANGTAVRWFIPSGTPSRLAEYRFDEYAWSGRVGEVADSSGNNNNGVRVGSAQTVSTGEVCRAADFPANTTTAISAVDTALDVDTSIGSSGTLSFWVRSNVVWTSATPAMLMDGSTVATRPFYIMRNAGGALRFSLADSAGTLVTATTAAQATAAATWLHVAATWRMAAGTNQTTLRIYVNGSLATTAIGTTNGNLDPSLGSLFVGDNRSAATPAGATANSANGQIDELRVYNFELSAAEITLDIAQTHSCAPPLDHLVVQHASGTGVTCTPASVTILACQDSGCITQYTGGVTGTMSSVGGTVKWPAGTSFSIPAGSGTTTVSLQESVAGSTLLGATSSSPIAVTPTTCNFGTPSCTFTAADSGLLFDVPAHVSDTAQSVTVTAVRKSDNSGVCTPAFASVSKAVAFSCGYSNPSSGSWAVRVGGLAVNSANNAGAVCDASGRAVTLAFNAAGVATTTVQYADVGQVQLNASYTGTTGGEVGLVMTGSDSFVTGPSSFAFSAITAAPIKAGKAFAATLTARNASNVATPNFGRESTPAAPVLSFTRASAMGAGAANGAFSGSFGAFTNGVASASNLVWSEVGIGDLSVSLGNYLGSGLASTGTTGAAGAVGRFIPDHFDVAVTPACGVSSYAGQPFQVQLTARNGAATPATTLNYDGSGVTSPAYAKATTLSEAVALGAGGFGSTGSVGAATFVRGLATLATPAYTYTTKLTPQNTLVVRATDTDGASSANAATPIEGSTLLRSGRLRLSSAWGSEKTALQIAVQAQYWSGKAWILNSTDNCTVVPAAAASKSNPIDSKGAASGAMNNTLSAITLAGGQASLSVSTASPATTGSIDIALNLGSVATDQSCVSGTRPASTGAALPWLRSQNGGCSTLWDRDPSARATFGIFSPESTKTFHARELF
ncbi:MAG: LamG domain-containing protein [Burkholderiaceae bacterium]